MNSDKERILEEAKATFESNINAGELSNLIDADLPLWQTDPDFINPYKELPPLQVWCEMGGRKALPKEGIVTFQAKQKRGKSLSTYAMALPLLSGKDFGTIHPLDTPNMVMVFDMEMGEITLTNRVLRQVQTLGQQGNKFVVCNLKAKSIEERIKLIQEKVARYNPDIVVIDQAAKLVNDINSTTETNIITDMLDKLSIGRSVWCVMHENKGDQDTNMRGHIGSYLSFANVESYGVDRKNGAFVVTYKEGRDTDAENAATFQFAVDVEGKIIDGTEILKEAEEKEKTEWQKNFLHLFGDDDELRAKELTARIVEREGIELRHAKNKISRAKELGVIRKTGNQKTDPYCLCCPIP